MAQRISFREERRVEGELGGKAVFEVFINGDTSEFAATVAKGRLALDAWQGQIKASAERFEAESNLRHIILHCTHSAAPINSDLIFESVLAGSALSEEEQDAYRARYVAARAKFDQVNPPKDAGSTAGDHKPFWE